MIESDQKTSLLIPSQLPEFIRDDPAYANFVLFLQSYYEWLEQNDNVTDRTKNILNYKDIDKTSTEFLDYFYNDFLSYFPPEILADKQKLIKLARELYQSKGTPSSYKFLFRVLYNSDVDFFYTKDAVLRASAGKWYIAKSLKLATSDRNFLNINNLRIFGELTKSIATIENSVVSGNKIEVFISDIQRLFQSGEFVRVVDSNNQDVLFDGEVLRAKIVGQISQIKIDPNNRGLTYRPADPIIVYGGLSSNTGHKATAEVGTTTSGSIQRIKVENGGFGYRAYPNTLIDITNAPGAVAIVGSLDPSSANTANATFIPTDYIGQKSTVTIGSINYNFANVAVSNANSSFANALSFTSFTTYPISSVLVQNGGGGITQTPVVSANSIYATQDNAAYVQLQNLGILAPIQIRNAGKGYQANDVINFTGGSGYGAYANVTSVNATGAIVSVSYVYPPNQSVVKYPLGGLGYLSGLPTLSVTSANVQASNASLVVTNVLGTGAVFTPLVDRVGSITSITITDPGEDYIAAPNVSFKVQDMVVTGLSITNLPAFGDPIYQGVNSNVSTYTATVDSVTLLQAYNDPLLSRYNLRVYNYNAAPNYNLPLKIDSKLISVTLDGSYHPTGSRYDNTGVVTYGDGTAKGTASFLNGLVLSSGQYLDTTGQPSSFDVLQSTVYNNYTYQITLEKEIAKYRKTLLDLLHPSGMKVLGRYALKSNSSFMFEGSNLLESGHTLGYYTGNPGSYATMSSTWTNQSNNIVNFYALAGSFINDIIVPGNSLTLTLSNGFKIHSEVLGSYGRVTEDLLSETGIEDLLSGTGTDDLMSYSDQSYVVLKDSPWLTFANVAYVTGQSGNNVINISTLTGSYDIVNNGNYSNTANPLQDIVFAGDKILVANNTEKTVSSVNYVSGIIYLTSNLTSNANSLMSVQRTVSTSTVRIDGVVGQVYYPQLTTEDDRIITTEDDQVIIIG